MSVMILYDDLELCGTSSAILMVFMKPWDTSMPKQILIVMI